MGRGKAVARSLLRRPAPWWGLLSACARAKNEARAFPAPTRALKYSPQPLVGPLWEAASGLAASVNKSLAAAPQLTFPLPGASGEWR